VAQTGGGQARAGVSSDGGGGGDDLDLAAWTAGPRDALGRERTRPRRAGCGGGLAQLRARAPARGPAVGAVRAQSRVFDAAGGGAAAVHRAVLAAGAASASRLLFLTGKGAYG
jgi:hypothetical protein